MSTECLWLTRRSVLSIRKFFCGVMDGSIFLAQSLCSTFLVWWRQLLQSEDLTVTHTQTHHGLSDILLYCLWKMTEPQTTWLHPPVVNLVRCWKTFSGPVEETVEKDKPGETGPHPHDHMEGDTCIIDQLGEKRRRNTVCFSFINFQSLTVIQNAFFKLVFIIYLDSRESDSRGGIRANHQGHDSRAQSAEHVGELKEQKRK